MFERILIPLDGSPRAEAILPQIARILKREDSEILLLAVPQPVAVMYGAEMGPPVVGDYRAESKAYLTRLENRLADQGVRVRSLTEDGPPAGTILETAERENATLIAMATHGRTGLARWVFGSVTEKVLRASPLPLLVLRSFQETPPPAAAEATPFARILVPVIPFHLRILPYVREFAALFGSRVTLLHVVEPGADPRTRTQALEEMNLVVRDFRQAGIPTESRERSGEPAVEILEAAGEEGADLIAITTHKSHGAVRWALGSVTEKVVRAATVPILVVRNL
jgi:nucleotide-binding universal stress UspA family protein